MPELPEVETMAVALDELVSGKKIKDVWFDWPKAISILTSEKLVYKGRVKDRLNLADSPAHQAIFKKSLRGLVIKRVSRRAKNILIYLSGGKLLLIHPKMTGHVLYGKWKIEENRLIPIEPAGIKERINSYVHFVLVLSNGWMIGLSDVRKFAKILFGDEDVVLSSRDIAGLGPEPIHDAFDLKNFKKIIRSSSGKAKQFLLNQNKIAGLGNIYADEVLWLSKVNPMRQVKSFSEPETERVFAAIKNVLEKAIKLRGTSMSDFRDVHGETGGYSKEILAYGRYGEKCLRCGILMKRVSIGGRSSTFCTNCQK